MISQTLPKTSQGADSISTRVENKASSYYARGLTLFFHRISVHFFFEHMHRISATTAFQKL